jgi:hypothetical protein
MGNHRSRGGHAMTILDEFGRPTSDERPDGVIFAKAAGDVPYAGDPVMIAIHRRSLARHASTVPVRDEGAMKTVPVAEPLP